MKIKIYQAGKAVAFGGLTKDMNHIFLISES